MATWDAASGSNNGAITSTSLTWTHTCTGSNGVLLVGATTSGTVSGVTYAGSAMTRLGSAQTVGTGQFSMWYDLAPSTGANSVVVTCSTSSAIAAGSESVAGAQQAAPTFNFTAANSSTTISNTITVDKSNMVIINFVAINANSTAGTPSNSQTEDSSQASSNGEATLSAHLVNPSVSTLTQGWSQSPFTNTWMLGLIGVEDVSAGGGATAHNLTLIGVGA